MDPADEMAAKIEPTERPSVGAVAGSIDKLDEQLRVSVEALLHPSPPRKPVEELDELISAISHHLDQESSERKAIYRLLLAIQNEMGGRESRGFARYLVAICIGVAATLVWQSYGEAAKRIIATRTLELGWSPETKQMIATSIQWIGWTKPPAGPEKQPPPVAQTAPTAPSLDPGQVQQNFAAMRGAVQELAAGQNQVAHEIAMLQSAVMEILEKMPAPPPQPPATPAHKPTVPPSSRAPIAPPSSRTLIPPRLVSKSHSRTVLHDERRTNILGRPRRREAAGGHSAFFYAVRKCSR
jgi:hypothetical protein